MACERNDYYPFGMMMPARTFRGGTGYRYGFNGKENDNEVKGEGNSLDFGERIYDPRISRFNSIDRFTAKTPGLTPFSFAANMPINAVDIKGDSVYILFHTVGNKRGDNMFHAAALTRGLDIRSSGHFDPAKDVVVVIQVQDLADIKMITENVVKEFSPQYGKTVEVGLWSHSGLDGPTGTKETSSNAVDKKQMSLEGWSKINFNWGENSRMNFLGCRAGLDPDGTSSEASFVTKVSALPNFKNVLVQGQINYSYPSRYSDYQFNEGRNDKKEANYLPVTPINKTYLVGVNFWDRQHSKFFVTPGAPASKLRTAINGSGRVTGFQPGSVSPPRQIDFGRPAGWNPPIK